MNRNDYHILADDALSEKIMSRQKAGELLTSTKIELFPLLNAAYEVRTYFKGKKVTIHIINNGQNGFCPEDCHYCAQAKSSKADIAEYPIKSDEEFIQEAQAAYEKGAFRYCMVFAGRGPTLKRTKHLASLIKKIKAKYPLEICISAGLLDQEKATIFKDAGLDRFNHNLNTSERHYPNICSTHTFGDRIQTLQAARQSGLQLCSGIIVGMDETQDDILDVAYRLRELQVESIPVNFLIPIRGNVLDQQPKLDPQFCLRVLCLFRFLNPKAEIRIAAGRELHLRSMEVMGLYPANSLFLEGYLNIKGKECRRTFQMIKDAGFTIQADQDLDSLLDREPQTTTQETDNDASVGMMKRNRELRPHLQSKPQL